MEIIKSISEKRRSLHEGHESQRILSNNHDYIGLLGEFAFGEFSGIMPDVKDRPEGDKGVDFTIYLKYSVDVKTFRKPYNLIHERGKVDSDIYVLAKLNETETKAELIGWEFGRKLAKAPTKEFGHGVENHFIPASNLRPMEQLRKRLLRFKK